MYPPKQNDYYPTAPPPPPAPMGVPVGASNQYYPPTTGPPAASHTQPQRRVQWSTGLCGCMEDCGSCCMTCCCPCVTFGRIAEIVDRGSTSCGTSGVLYTLMGIVCCHWIYTCGYRTKLRGQFNLASSPCNDCLVHCCCGCFALCQEYRELKNHGLDPKIGWHANMGKQATATTYPPGVQGGMAR